MLAHPRRLLFAAFLAGHLLSPIKTNFDSRWTIPTAISLLREGNLDLDEYSPTLASGKEAVIRGQDGHWYSYFPLGVPLLAAVPLAAFQPLAHAACADFGNVDAIGRGCERWFSHYEAVGAIDPDFFDTTQLLIASLLVAFTGLLVFELARERLPVAHSAGLALLFVFGTSAWSTASRALWQHGPSMLALASALLALRRWERGRGPVWPVAALLAAAFTLRPTNAIPFVVIAVYVLRKQPRALVGCFLAATAVLAPWVLLSRATYGVLLPPYYLPERVAGASTSFWEALPGDLVSPGRGLLVFSPFLALVAWDFVARVRSRSVQPLEWALALVLVLHAMAIARFPHWWAGHSFGPRFYCDMLPVLMVLTIPAVARATAPGPFRWGFLFTAIVSVAIHAQGANRWAVYEWNGTPVNVDDCPRRVWDWADLQFLRRLGHPPPAPAYCPTVTVTARARDTDNN